MHAVPQGSPANSYIRTVQLHSVMHSAATRAAPLLQCNERAQLWAQLLNRPLVNAAVQTAKDSHVGLHLHQSPRPSAPAPAAFLAACVRSATWLRLLDSSYHKLRLHDVIQLSFTTLALQAGEPWTAQATGSSSSSSGGTAVAEPPCISPSTIAAIDCVGALALEDYSVLALPMVLGNEEYAEGKVSAAGTVCGRCCRCRERADACRCRQAGGAPHSSDSCTHHDHASFPRCHLPASFHS